MVLRIAALALFTFAPPALAQHEVPDDEVYSPRVSGASEEGQQAITGTIVSAGFRVELFAAEPHLANPVVFAIDPKLRFFVAETFRLHAGVTDMRSHMNWLHDELACRTVEDRVAMMRKHEGARFDERYAVEHERIKLVWDEDGDGVADTSTVYADGFANPADGIAAGVLPLGEDVYYACIPDLWVLRDEDGDGVADRRKSLHTGWGVHIALLGHDMHGLMRGPDGRLYWSIGDRGFHVEHEGKTFAHPHAGAVLRSELDGSNLEVFATGLRNPQELCFDDHGNLWTGDNNSDGGDRARWTYVLEGAEIGWRHAFQYVGFPNSRGPWNAEKVWHPPHAGQPAYTVPPVANFSDGPSGLAYYPGTGFGPDWRGHFFLCDFRGGPSNSGVHAFRVEAKGAGFELVDPKRFVWNCLPTDVDFGPDGNLYYSDWVNGWGMTGKGRIYRVTTDEYADERTELRQIFADGMQGREAAQLRRLLGHGNQRVRLEAQWELAERGEHALLLEAATDPQANALARLHGLWGLGHLLRVDGREAARVVRELLSLHDDPDLEVRAQLYKLLGDLRWLDAVPLALRALEDDSARVRSFAAQALGQMGDARAFGPLVDLLASNDDQDPWLRHAAVWALVSLGDGDRIAGLSQHEHPAVRRGAVVALRRLAHPGLARFVADADRSVVAEAARAIYDAPVPEAMTDLAMLLPSITPGDEHYLARRALLANRYLGG
ncbi:MAG: HEAT repeat domain-containing protein, partial [Planctomycetota bacterium]|nr:HEAT repeat domain-containing protein [Planctomycetota bacterium]